MSYLNFLNQKTVFRDNKTQLIFRGRPRLLVVQFNKGTFYLGSPNRLDVDEGLKFSDGGIFSLGYSDLMLRPGDFLELHARTPDTIIAGSEPSTVVLYMEEY